MCGNGIHCVGNYLFDHGMVDFKEKDEITIETLSGIKNLQSLYSGRRGHYATRRYGVSGAQSRAYPRKERQGKNDKREGQHRRKGLQHHLRFDG